MEVTYLLRVASLHRNVLSVMDSMLDGILAYHYQSLCGLDIFPAGRAGPRPPGLVVVRLLTDELLLLAAHLVVPQTVRLSQ